MIPMAPAYPYPGCIVEYIENNTVHIAIVLEENGGKFRLLLPGRKESKISLNRLLPWFGPVYPVNTGKEELIKKLDFHRENREEKAAHIDTIEIWELTQGEVNTASTAWISELMESAPNEDAVAAYGHALLGCKTHFRFNPPEFQIYDEETVNKRLEEQRLREEKEAITQKGTSFIRLLWEIANKRKALPEPESDEYPSQALQERIRNLLLARVANPDSTEDDSLWRMLSRGLPEVPFIPLQLLIAWGVLPRHYNFWLDRADYAANDLWWHEYSREVENLREVDASLPVLDHPFISIDGPTTRDIDDAFFIEKKGDITHLVIALAAPARKWEFGSGLDKLVAERGTSVYLPEGTLHMLPETLGVDAYSLLENQTRPAFYLELDIDGNGQCIRFAPGHAQVKLAANLHYEDAQKILDNAEEAENQAAPFREQLQIANELAKIREKLRINDGAVIMTRPEPVINLEYNDNEVKVTLEAEPATKDAQRLVSEMMILASAEIAKWAQDNNLPLIFRTQNVVLPKEYAGIWTNPADAARIMHSLGPSLFETTPKPHAALGLDRYAQITSPLRRYGDLINEAQVLHFLETGSSKWNIDELQHILDSLTPVLDKVGQIQRFRPRYWKLLYLRQLGEKEWHNGIITEENDMYVNVALPDINLNVRGRRHIFGDRVYPAMNVQIRLGKINPLLNDIQIIEVMALE